MDKSAIYDHERLIKWLAYNKSILKIIVPNNRYDSRNTHNFVKPATILNVQNSFDMLN